MTIQENTLNAMNTTRIAMLLYVDQREPVMLSEMVATYGQTEALEWLDEQGLIAVTKGGSCAVTTRVGHDIVLEFLKPSTEK